RVHSLLFFFNDTATTEIYTLSLHDALPIFQMNARFFYNVNLAEFNLSKHHRSEEHTSELQSLAYLVCRLLLETKTHMRTAQTTSHFRLQHTLDTPSQTQR